MPHTVLILGAGINGAALARELALNGLSVVVVDTRDIAAGATAYSSRLIHGGLRYLEYGDFALVREALGERTRLLRLAPQFVRPLRLFIPVRNRFGGLWSAARRFLGVKVRPKPGQTMHRGLYTVRFGLWLYDKYARDPTLPQHRAHRADDPDIVPVDRSKYEWVCSFSDAQLVFPERFTLALLEDARRIAAERGTDFRVLTYHEAVLAGHTVAIRAVGSGNVAYEIQPAVIVNATGSWVDLTLKKLGVESKRLMGGTKGSHFVTSHRRLQELLAGRAVYTEAGDGRPVFILPFVNGTLVGTTDEPFEGDPADAVATPRELEYLVEAVNDVFPDLGLTVADIDLHYAGVRPLPYSGPAVPASITRRHWLEPNPGCEIPLYSVIGGKLTTCRSLAEEAAGAILERLGLPRIANSEQRPLPGAEDYPDDATELRIEWQRQAGLYGLSRESVEAVWKLCGTGCQAALAESIATASTTELLHGTPLPKQFARWVIRHQWCTRLDDLIERRLMLLYHPTLTRQCLADLADLLIEAGLLTHAQKDAEMAAVTGRLRTHFGKQVI